MALNDYTILQNLRTFETAFKPWTGENSLWFFWPWRFHEIFPSRLCHLFHMQRPWRFFKSEKSGKSAAKIILKHSKLSKKVGVPCEFRCSWCSCSNLIQFVLWFARLWRWHWSLGASWSSQGYWGFPHWMILGILGPLGSIIKKSSTNFLEISGNANKSLCEASLLGLSGCSGHWIKWNPFSNTIAQPRQWHQSPNFLYHHHHHQQ